MAFDGKSLACTCYYIACINVLIPNIVLSMCVYPRYQCTYSNVLVPNVIH